MKNWEDFGVYEEVPDEGQKTLQANWVLVRKLIDGNDGSESHGQQGYCQGHEADDKDCQEVVRRATKMKFVDLGPVTEWTIEGQGDAGY